MRHDALGAHARDELGISEISTARPLQAAGASAVSFAAGAALPLSVVALAPDRAIAWAVAGAALIALVVLGGLAARTGGAKLPTGCRTSDVLERVGHSRNVWSWHVCRDGGAIAPLRRATGFADVPGLP
jgi:hypothetical protein